MHSSTIVKALFVSLNGFESHDRLLRLSSLHAYTATHRDPKTTERIAMGKNLLTFLIFTIYVREPSI